MINLFRLICSSALVVGTFISSVPGVLKCFCVTLDRRELCPFKFVFLSLVDMGRRNYELHFICSEQTFLSLVHTFVSLSQTSKHNLRFFSSTFKLIGVWGSDGILLHSDFFMGHVHMTVNDNWKKKVNENISTWNSKSTFSFILSWQKSCDHRNTWTVPSRRSIMCNTCESPCEWNRILHGLKILPDVLIHLSVSKNVTVFRLCSNLCRRAT